MKPSYQKTALSRRSSIEERFSKHSRWEGECRIWGSCTQGGGYGVLTVKGRRHLAHRLAWIERNGNIPAGMYVCHRCDEPRCINPDHLFLGTQTDNMRDASRKGRVSHGEKNHNARLTATQALAIYNDSRNEREIAKAYGVHFGHVNDIKRGRRWRRVTGQTPLRRCPPQE